MNVQKRDQFEEHLFRTLEKKGRLFVQYSKRINVNIASIDETFRQFNRSRL